MINKYLNLDALTDDEVEAERHWCTLQWRVGWFSDWRTSEHEGSHDQTSLSVLGCVDHHSCIQLALSSHKNHASVERARLIYKMFHGVRVNVVRDDLLPSYESCSTSKGKMKEGYKVADIPCIIYRLLQSQHQLKRKPKEKRVPTIQYKKDALLGKEYITNKKEKTRSCKRSCRRSSKKAKKKGNSGLHERHHQSLDHRQAQIVSINLGLLKCQVLHNDTM